LFRGSIVIANHFVNLIGPALAAFLLVVVTLALMKSVAAYYGVVSGPNSGSPTRHVIPLVGGIANYIGYFNSTVDDWSDAALDRPADGYGFECRCLR